MTELSRIEIKLISIPLGVAVQFLSASLLITEASFQFHLGAFLMFLYSGVLVSWRIFSKSRGIPMIKTSRGLGFLAFVSANIATELGLIALNLLYGESLAVLFNILTDSGLAALASFAFIGLVYGFSYSIFRLQKRTFGLLQVGEEYELSITRVNKKGVGSGKLGRTTIFVPGVGQGWHGTVRITSATPGIAEAVPVP